DRSFHRCARALAELTGGFHERRMDCRADGSGCADRDRLQHRAGHWQGHRAGWRSHPEGSRQMKAFTIVEGLAIPLDRANVDTDAIIPKQFLKSIKRSGFGPNLFDEWRYLDRGEPGQDCSSRPLNPDFVLNQPRYKGAQVMLTRDNFGCG